MSYFFIHNTEDGVVVTQCFNQDAAKRYIEGITSDDLRFECRANFIDTLPNAYSPTEDYLVIKGDVVVPQPVTTVTEYAL